MEGAFNISLVDNTAPSQQAASGESPRRASHSRQGSLTRNLSRVSVAKQITKRKYAKWQPDRLGAGPNPEASLSQESSRAPGGSISAESTDTQDASNDTSTETTRVDTTDHAASGVPSLTGNTTIRSSTAGLPVSDPESSAKPRTELDILYENQRGWFLFGVPWYSHRSLLNFDPSAWMTQDRRDSPVNITNAQVPDPSWEWAWRTWYVDMSGDVDEQGWQYSVSFKSSQWHGTHPWFHSFVRRRRWVRLRSKIPEKRHRERTEFEKGHMLNEDYFTIHSSKAKSREQSIAGASRVESGFLSRVGTKVEEEPQFEEIGDVPSLMNALKSSSIDRERLDALKRFIKDGGEEIYYLNDKVPEILSMFLFQASRWQFLDYLTSTAQNISQDTEDQDDKDAGKLQRRKDNLIRVAQTVQRHITGPDGSTDIYGGAAAELLDLTPISKHDTLLSRRSLVADEPLLVLKEKGIKGISKAAEVGREDHIY
ncbi:hypothetical protein N7468_004501 [Penicillium chermesinum]|uniref:Peroxin/Ferlin domain-containing protein n=1 Tax=Penicillium chermesinum TaxID=63820 RepID=A0A9W9P8Q4_9EURO|nr:uncharacterized protein N7468_004501 [Penicillium chermesinum]KAJ5239882.1 hypothetical protein N7468_004501 [Penicillium chermesinum]KAJ6166761.1 hypothetical protein N7470_002208 [Penicillium chermesinum]